MIIEGKAYWAKILGNPVPNFFEPEKREWSIDIAVDDDTMSTLVEAGVSKNQFKTKDNVPGYFLSFRRKAVKADGTPGQRIPVVDDHNREWDQSKLIGNGSNVKASIALNDGIYKGKKTKRPGLLSLMVWDLVEYQRKPVFEPRAGDAPSSEQRAW